VTVESDSDLMVRVQGGPIVQLKTFNGRIFIRKSR